MKRLIWYILGAGSSLLILLILGIGGLLMSLAQGPVSLLLHLETILKTPDKAMWAKFLALVGITSLVPIVIPLALATGSFSIGAWLMAAGTNTIAEKLLPDLYEAAWEEIWQAPEERRLTRCFVLLD